MRHIRPWPRLPPPPPLLSSMLVLAASMAVLTCAAHPAAAQVATSGALTAPADPSAYPAAFAEMWAYMERPTNRTYLVAASLGRGTALHSTQFEVELAGQTHTYHWDVGAGGWNWGDGPLPTAAFTVRVDAEGAGAMVYAYLAHRDDTQAYRDQQAPDHLGRVMAVLRAMADGLHAGHVLPDNSIWSPPMLDLLGAAEYVVAIIDDRAMFNLNVFLDGQTDVLDLGVLGRFDLTTLRYTNLYVEAAMVLGLFGVSLWVLHRAHRNRRGW